MSLRKKGEFHGKAVKNIQGRIYMEIYKSEVPSESGKSSGLEEITWKMLVL